MSDSLACTNVRMSLYEKGSSLSNKLGLLASEKKFEAKVTDFETVKIQAFSTDTFSVGKKTTLVINLMETGDLKKKFEIEIPWPDDCWDNPKTKKENDYEKYLPLKIWVGTRPPTATERTNLLSTLKKIPMKPDYTLLQRTIELLENCRFVELY